ncbi:hypothetical protein [Fluviicola sp.]|uniref:hypothetical protein n=1 Tax=Fluviicola sp. TaxID=1917219 RepID=UPI002606EC5D|nr:hypothetical protein [Fluviicola sp.]
METNWNQLIERYLQNELSEEGKIAFEQELAGNEALREELELHQLVQSAAKRASQRVMVQQAGKSYFRNLRIKQFTIAGILTITATVGIVYWVQNEKTEDKSHQINQSEAIRDKQDNPALSADESTNQPNLSGDKSSLIHSSDSCSDRLTDSKISTMSNLKKATVFNENQRTAENGSVKSVPGKIKADSVFQPKPTTVVLGYTEDKLHAKETETKGLPEWTKKYDSIGKFNDLYCGYALVMDKAKFGFVDNNGKVFIPLVYDQIVVTTNIKTSKQKNKRQKKKILYIPKRSGKDVKDCEEESL